MIFETKRLILREMQQADYLQITKMLQDQAVMYAYEHAFSDDEVQAWLDKQLNNYRQFGYGLWAVILKETNELIGQCGLTPQDFNAKKVIEIGYLFQKAYWHQGYALEAANGCKEYAFNVLKEQAVYSIIRDNNQASINVAIRNGMHICGSFTKHYYGIEMPHLVFIKENPENI